MAKSDIMKAQLAEVGQEHLLAFWDDLSEPQRRQLETEIQSIDWPQLKRLVADADETPDWQALAARAEPPPAIRLDASNEVRRRAKEAGEAALRQGEVAMILVAGGQGTRLGFPHPKGMFSLGPVSKRSLFQILFEQVLARSRRYKTRLPVMLMTSPATDAETREYLAQHNRFGLPQEDLFIFCQGVMPAVDAATGKALLADKGELALSPDGHGGMLAALVSSGCLDELRRRGVKHVYYCQIDNPLASCCDPELIGHHLLAGSEMTTQAVAKVEPLERVGNIVSIDGRLSIIEYSDLPADAAQRRNADGSLALWAGNMAIHVFETSFLERMAGLATALPFHRARKAVPFINEHGEVVKSEQTNALKFERFIFDLLPQAERAIVVEADKATAFAPVKNADGAASDTAQHSQQAMMALHVKWLRQAGVEVNDGVPVEISPLFALEPDDLRAKVKPGQRIARPTFFE